MCKMKAESAAELVGMAGQARHGAGQVRSSPEPGLEVIREVIVLLCDHRSGQVVGPNHLIREEFTGRFLSEAQELTQLARCTWNRYLLILKRLILESSVRAGSPNFVAAPDGPEIRP